MILIDTGPIVAILNNKDDDHFRCTNISRSIQRAKLITTWPCFTEAMYLLGRDRGHPCQDALWALRKSGVVDIYHLTLHNEFRMHDLMSKYADSPMDLADASLVAAAESLGVRRIFTLDQHFNAYRMVDGSPFDVIS